MGKVTGIGGIFFKSQNPGDLNKWYSENLGIRIEREGSASFKWRDYEDAKTERRTVWSIFDRDTKYFEPGRQDFMINYIVDNLEELLEELKAKGIGSTGNIEDYEYGRFAWVVDPEGKKIELWQPA